VPIGLVLLGLDDFRAFVERQGPVAADAVLVECARRLAGGTGRAARAGRVVARLGADQFGVLFDARIEAGALVDRVPEWALARIEEPFLFETIEEASAGSRTGAHRLTASAGWAFTGQGNFSPDDLFAAAESALARAKAAGTGHARLFDPTQPRIEASRRALREDLERGLQAGEFQLDYQPIVRLSDRALLGFEALIRWRHPSRGPVLPDDLIPAAEESGHLMAIGRWTLIEAALQLRRWREIGFKGEVAINLSAAQLAQGDVLLADAREALKALGEVSPSQLRLEVAERAAMAWPQRHAELLQALARLGFGLSIDDVGSAQSSLAHLHRFPVDTLKIDRSFVTRLGEGGEAQEVVRTIVGLARARGWRTLAEGVETQAQAALLETLGVEMAQGWLFAQALPAEDARRLIQTVPGKKPAASPPPARSQAMP
jgi:EAL domain-containing protein (putative c-di-GMP-specific phosphodiesterase class I)/GGDEF domain-containing protein